MRPETGSTAPREPERSERTGLAGLIGLLALAACAAPTPGASAPSRAVASDLAPPLVLEIPGTAHALELVAIPGGVLEAELPGSPAARHEVAPFRLARSEITWELYDTFVYGLDQPQPDASAAGADGIARPSKPYITVDRGFGHAGWPAISMSGRGAEAFCAWLARRTGHPLRLPTAAELAWAARAGGAAEGWTAANSDARTHAVATLAPNALGLHDLLGNAAEWCRAEDGSLHVFGGSFRDPPATVEALPFVSPTPMWNASDPQVPKSTWWLADAPFVGLRVALDGPP